MFFGDEADRATFSETNIQVPLITATTHLFPHMLMILFVEAPITFLIII
jgi:hypothetical protein